MEKEIINEELYKYKTYTMQELLREYEDACTPNHFDISNSGTESTQEKYCILAKKLREIIIAKVKGDDQFFVMMNKETNMPYVDRIGRVLICSSEEIVNLMTNEFQHRFIDLGFVSVTQAEKDLFFYMLFELNGIREIVLDNGSYGIALSKNELWKERVNMTGMPEVPFKNPGLVSAMMKLEQERRWKVSYPEKMKYIQEYESEFIDQLLHAKFFVPAKRVKEEIVNGIQNVQFEIPRLTGSDNTFATPLFTDVDRMKEMFHSFAEDTDVLVWGLEDLLHAVPDPIFVINCNEISMVIDKKFIQHVLDTRMGSMIAN